MPEDPFRKKRERRRRQREEMDRRARYQNQDPKQTPENSWTPQTMVGDGEVGDDPKVCFPLLFAFDNFLFFSSLKWMGGRVLMNIGSGTVLHDGQVLETLFGVFHHFALDCGIDRFGVC